MDLKKRSPNVTDDNKYFKSVFDSNYEKVLGYVNSFVQDIEEAHNVSQETFIVFWDNIDRIDRKTNPLPYLLFVAKNKALNSIKRDMVKRKYDNMIASKELELNYKSLRSSTLESVLLHEVENKINECISKMSDSIRETFILSRYKNLKNSEIANLLNVNIKTVEYRMMVALKYLRKHLREFMGGVYIFLTDFFEKSGFWG